MTSDATNERARALSKRCSSSSVSRGNLSATRTLGLGTSGRSRSAGCYDATYLERVDGVRVIGITQVTTWWSPSASGVLQGGGDDVAIDGLAYSASCLAEARHRDAIEVAQSASGGFVEQRDVPREEPSRPSADAEHYHT